MLDTRDLITLRYSYVLVLCHHRVVYVKKLLVMALISLFIRARAARAIVVIELVFVQPDSCDFVEQATICKVAHWIEAT